MLGGNGAAAAPLAQTNLLGNGGFDSGYYNVSGDADVSVAGSWAPWHENTIKSDCPPCNYTLRPKWSAEYNSALILQGSASQHVGNQYDPWHGGVFQTVAVPAGSRVVFSVSARVRASNEQFPAPSYGFNSGVQVGADPNGSGVWNSGVTWSSTINPHDVWQTVSIETTVGAAGKVSVYVAANWRGNSAAHLDAWFDNASLIVTSSSVPPTTAPGATSAPQPTSGAQPPLQLTSFPTPTAGPDGRIIYIVQPGDTLWRIAATAGLTVEQLKALNNLGSDIISSGQQLVLGTVQVPATAIPTATLATQGGGGGEATPGPSQPAQPTMAVGVGSVCFMLYEDVNGSGLRDPGEGLIAGGQFLVANASGQPVDAYTTTSDANVEPHCSQQLAVGGYTIALALPAGYNSTTTKEFPLNLEAGSTINLEFGGQKSATAAAVTQATPVPATASNTRMRTALYGAIGVIFLLLAAGLAGFLFLSRRSG